MTDTNHVILIGRLTRDAELKYTNSGTAVTRLSVAVNRSRKTADQWTDEVNFFDIVLWGKLGETLNKYLTKGKQIAVDGELRQNRWEQDGQSRSKVEVVANNIQLLGGSQGGASASSGENFGSNRPSGKSAMDDGPSAPSFPADDNFEDDIPF